MADDTWNMITNRMTFLKDRHDRMDKTKELLYTDDYPFKLRDFKDTHDLDNVVNVTGNNASVFATAIISDLMGSKWQTVVEGKISSRQSNKIEQFIEDNFAQIDEMLLNKFGMPGLHAWLCNHVCVRSWIGARFISQIKDGEYVVDCLPVDMRWTPFMYGENGLRWVTPISFMSNDELREEFEEKYPSEFKKIALVGKGTTEFNEVRDYWGCEKNEIWINKAMLIEQGHNLKEPPFAIAFPPAGFMLRDKGYMKHEAEDLFFLNQGLYKELNRSLSIEQTIGMDILYPPYEQEVESMNAEPAQAPPKTGETIKVKKGERHQPVPRGDLNKASMVARQDIQRMIEIGGHILPRAYTQPPSAVEVQTEIELLARWHYPRKVALVAFREQLIRLMIDQYLIISEGEGESELLIGRRGRKTQYSVKQLGDPDTYSISCELTTGSRREDIANWALAGQAWGKAPRRAIFKGILKVEDPDGWERELSLEEAKRADPAIALFEMAIRYAEEAEELEDEALADVKRIQSKMLTERGVFLINQRKQPMQQLPEKASVPQVEEPAKVEPKELLPLMGRGRGGGGIPVTTPEEI